MQTQKFTSLEIISRPQLSFSSRPRKEAKPVGWCQEQPQWLMTPALSLTNQWWPWPWKGTPGELMTILLKYSPKTLPKIPACKREIKAVRQMTQGEWSPSGSSQHYFLSPFLPLLLLHQAHISQTLRQWAAHSSSQANPLNLSPKTPFALTSQWTKAAQPRVSCWFFYAKHFPVSLFPALINGSSQSPGLMLWNLSYTKSRSHTLQLALGRPTQGQAPVR